jgi:hypothetical protein
VKPFKDFFNETNLHILNERIYGNTGWVYHRTRTNPENSDIVKFGINTTLNTSAMYGTGFYTTYNIEDQNRDRMKAIYGKYIVKGKINLSNFVILDRPIFDMLNMNTTFEKYLENIYSLLPSYVYQVENKHKFENDSDDPDDRPYRRTSQIARDFWKQFKKNGYRGIIFTGALDGHVAVIWDRQSFIPSSYSTDDGSSWVKLKSDIRYIYRPIDELTEYDPQKHNEKTNNQLTSKLPKSIRGVLGNVKESLRYIKTHSDLSGKIKNILLHEISKDPESAIKIAVEEFQGVDVPPIILHNIGRKIYTYIDFLLRNNLPVANEVISVMGGLDDSLVSVYIDKLINSGVSFNHSILSKIDNVQRVIRYINIFIQRGGEIPHVLYTKIGQSKEYKYISDLLLNDKIDHDLLSQYIPSNSMAWVYYYHATKSDPNKIPKNILIKLLENGIMAEEIRDPFDAVRYVEKYSDISTIRGVIFKLISTEPDAAMICVSYLLHNNKDVPNILWKSIIDNALLAKMFATEDDIPYSKIPVEWKQKLIDGGMGWMFGINERKFDKHFKDFFNHYILNEYRHNLADGTPAPSLQANNGKNPNILDKKILHTVGPYKKKVEKLNVVGSILTFPELEEAGIKDIMDLQLPTIFRNVKNSKADIQVFKNKKGMIVGRVIKPSPGLGK